LVHNYNIEVMGNRQSNKNARDKTNTITAPSKRDDSEKCIKTAPNNHHYQPAWLFQPVESLTPTDELVNGKLPTEIVQHLLGFLSFLDSHKCLCICRKWRDFFLSRILHEQRNIYSQLSPHTWKREVDSMYFIERWEVKILLWRNKFDDGQLLLNTYTKILTDRSNIYDDVVRNGGISLGPPELNILAKSIACTAQVVYSYRETGIATNMNDLVSACKIKPSTEYDHYSSAYCGRVAVMPDLTVYAFGNEWPT
jgi:hypothetical protein